MPIQLPVRMRECREGGGYTPVRPAVETRSHLAVLGSPAWRDQRACALTLGSVMSWEHAGPWQW
jgi:hypothetical protein